MTDQDKMSFKPCPFCGSEPIFTGSKDRLEGIVECSDISCPNESGYDVDLWQNRAELSRRAPSAEDKLRDAVVEAAIAVKHSKAGVIPDYANPELMDEWAIGIKRIVELCAAVDDLAALREGKP
jgi:hypothetical protein